MALIIVAPAFVNRTKLLNVMKNVAMGGDPMQTLAAVSAIAVATQSTSSDPGPSVANSLLDYVNNSGAFEAPTPEVLNSGADALKAILIGESKANPRSSDVDDGAPHPKARSREPKSQIPGLSQLHEPHGKTT